MIFEQTLTLGCINYMRLTVLLCMLICCSCNKEGTIPNPISPTPTPAVKVNNWLALGDSYTIGQGVAENERYPFQTVQLLKATGVNIDTLNYIARTGWTTTDLMRSMEQANPRQHSVVSLLIGVNDQYQGVPAEDYRVRFRAVLGKAIGLAGGKKENVVVISIPDYGVTPYSSQADTLKIRKEIDLFNDINKEETGKFGCPYLYITTSSRMARDYGNLICPDGLHPSGLEYGKWAQELAPLIQQILK